MDEHIEVESGTEPNAMGGQPQQDNSEELRQDNADQPHQESGDQPHQESGDQPHKESTDQPQPESGDQPQRESTDQPQPESVDKPQRERTNQPQPESTDQPQPESGDQPQRESTDQPQPESADQPQQDSADQSHQESVDQLQQESSDISQPESLDKPQEESADQLQEESADQPQEESVDQPQPESAEQQQPESVDQPQPESADHPHQKSTEHPQPESEAKIIKEDSEAKSDAVNIIQSIINTIGEEKGVDSKSEEIMEESDDADQKSGSSKDEFTLVVSSESEESMGESEEVDEEETSVQPDDDSVYNRANYLQKFRNLLLLRHDLQLKNDFLHRKLVEHYTSRKMETAFKPIESQGLDMEIKFHKALTMYEEMKLAEFKECGSLEIEVQDMMQQKDYISEMLETEFSILVAREKEVATGLVNTKTGKIVPDKVINNLIKRQTNKVKDVSKIRQKYIQLRNYVLAKEMSLRDLETLGEGLHLVNYEQLQMENESYSAKIEERDEELQRLRDKTTTCIHTLAHVREKASATSTDMQAKAYHLQEAQLDAKNARGYVGRLKKQRDYLRSETQRLLHESGLLMQPRLLHDYEESIEKVIRLSAQLQNMKNSYYDQKRSIEDVRETIKLYNIVHASQPHTLVETPSGGQSTIKGRTEVKEWMFTAFS